MLFIVRVPDRGGICKLRIILARPSIPKSVNEVPIYENMRKHLLTTLKVEPH
jgi:hypothetical protein